MNIIFMRHSEAVDNVRGVLSCKEIRCSVLTEAGFRQVAKSVSKLPREIDKIYSSPLIRTLQTAKEIMKVSGAEVVIDNRIREIDWGEYDGKPNNPELDAVRTRQAAGDFFVRFGQYGDNKYSLELRLCEFLDDVRKHNFKNNTIAIVSHGTVISFMKRILGLQPSHLKKGGFEEFSDIDFSKLDEHEDKLAAVKNKLIANRMKLIRRIQSNTLRNTFYEIAEDCNNIEFGDDGLARVISGYRDNITPITDSDVRKNNDLAVVCLFKNMSDFIEKWIDHYINLGVKNFVFLDNNSTDDSIDKIKTLSKKYSIMSDIWSVPYEYNCFRSCGWRQQIMDTYGVNRWYLNVDSDEMFVFSDTKLDISTYANDNLKNNIASVKAMMVDVYSDKPIFSNKSIEDFRFFDARGYKKIVNKHYGERIYGGPRSRIFGIKPSLQKVPLLYYTGVEILANDHFLFPWHRNPQSVSSVLLHYKFLPGSLESYAEMAKSEIHWNQSKEYKRYIQLYNNNPNAMFYQEGISLPIEEFSIEMLLSL